MKTTQIALITGANRGLGFATARDLAKHDITVILGCRDLTRGEDAAAELRRKGLDVEAVALDVTSVASVAQAVKEIEARFGRLNILINNAGVLPEATTAEQTQPLDLTMFRTTYESNVFGVVNVVQAFVPLLRNSAAGRIVNVSSTMGSLSDQQDPTSPYFSLVVPAYQTSKAALNALTVVLAKALPELTVNAVCPGWVQTDLGGPENRAAAPTTAAEAAEVVATLALKTSASGTFVDKQGLVAW